MISLTLQSDKDDMIEFKLNAPPSFANTLRRYVMSRVRVFAIDEVVVYSNTSVMFDEYIAHRLGMVPLTTPDIAGEDVKEVSFYLDVKGPKTVYAGELEGADEEVKVARPNIPVISLSEGEELRLEAIARCGTALTHAKYQAGLSSYKIEDDESISFFTESFSQMPAKQLVIRALNEMKSDLEAIKQGLKN